MQEKDFDSEEYNKEGRIEEEDYNKEEIIKEVTRDEMVTEMMVELSAEYPNDTFTFSSLDDIKYDLIEIIANARIAFRQIIDISFTVDENKERVKGSYERNLRALEKLSKEYKEKHNQEIVYMDQAEVTSVKTIKDAE